MEQRRFGAEQPRRAGEKGWAAARWRKELKRPRTQALSLRGRCPSPEELSTEGQLPGPEAPGRSESTASQAPVVVVGVHLGDCGIRDLASRMPGLGGLDYQGLGLPLSLPAFTFTLPNICQAQGPWFWLVVPGALIISLGLSFLQPFLGRRRSAGVKCHICRSGSTESLGNQIRLVLDLQGRAENLPSAHPPSQANRSRNGRVPNHRKTNTYKFSQSGPRSLEGRSWRLEGTVEYPSECQLAGVHSPLQDMVSLRSGQCFLLPTTEMAQREMLGV